MIPLPLMKENQFAVLQAETVTGIVLQVNGKRNTGQGNVYSVFDDYSSANVFARRIITEKPETECLIYNHRQEALNYLSSLETKDLRKEK